MILRKTALSCLVFSCIVFSVFAQKQQLAKIDVVDLKRHLSFISSDELQGRKLGTEVDGLGITADYLIEHAKSIGLKPGAVDYFQKVPMVLSKPDNSGFIKVQSSKGKVLFESKSLIRISNWSGITAFENEAVIVAGFGENILTDALEGKIVIIAQGNTESFKKEDSFRWNNRLEREKIAAISEKHPKAIIFVTNPQDKKNKTFQQIKTWFSRERYSLKTDQAQAEIPVLLTTPDFANKLLGGKGKFEKYLWGIAENKRNGLLSVKGKNISLKTGSKLQPVDAKNVIGIVEGSDPILKNEFVVFLAHYDHLGINKEGDVYNGADDNGSGTVAIMEVAEAFASLEEKPKRSIVFLWVTCEEIGHIGSTYYCDNPVFPLENTVAAINLDMVGRVYESPRDGVFKNSPKKVKDFDGLYTLSNDVWPQLAQINDTQCKVLGIIPDSSLPKERFLRSSDHYHFHKKGVPILNYATGYHADYHKVGDEVEKINFDKIKRVADLCFLLGYQVANLEIIEF